MRPPAGAGAICPVCDRFVDGRGALGELRCELCGAILPRLEPPEPLGAASRALGRLPGLSGGAGRREGFSLV